MGHPHRQKRVLCKLTKGTLHTKFVNKWGHMPPVPPVSTSMFTTKMWPKVKKHLVLCLELGLLKKLCSVYIPSALSDNVSYMYLYGCFRCDFSEYCRILILFFVPCHCLSIPED